jgi:uncharacterized protein with GYD domain
MHAEADRGFFEHARNGRGSYAQRLPAVKWRIDSPKCSLMKVLAKQFGVTAKEFYWTLGSYDVVGIFDARDDASMTALGLAIGAGGNVRAQTLRAFSREEMNGVLAKLA